MSDIDLERLGDLWREEPDPAEMAELRRSADSARRRARWGQVVDAVAAVVVGGVVVLLVASNATVETVLGGGATILILLASQIRQRRLRQIEIKALGGGAEEMLDQFSRRAEATLKRLRFSLFALAPALLAGYLLGTMLERQSGESLVAELVSGSWDRRLLLVFIPAALMLTMTVYLLRSMRRTREELERLHVLRQAYRQEREDGAAE